MINETISIDAGPAIAELDALASAAEGAAAKVDAAFKGIKVPSLGGSGAAGMARSLDAAAAKMETSVGKIEASFARLKGVGAEAEAAMGGVGKVASDSAAGIARLAAAEKAAADAGARVSKSSTTAADGLKGLGDTTKTSSAWLDEYNATMAETAKMQADFGRVSQDTAAKVAMSQRLQTAVARDASADAIAAQRAQRASAKEAAAAQASSHGKMRDVLLGTGLALAYGVDKAMKFNAQMALLVTQAGVSSRQMPELSKGVLKLAGQVGQSPGNLAESLYHVESNMSSLGIKAPAALNLVKVAAEGASVGHANLVDVTNALTAAVASGIPGVKNMSQAMGVLNSTVGSGDMSMQDLADAMGTGVLAVIKGYGANIKDAGAALATFGDNNIRGAHAGTDLRMAIQALAVPAASAKDKLKALGLTTSTLADTMQKHGMLSALEQLDTAFRKHGVTAKNEGQVLTDLFGKKAGVGLAILMEQMGRLESKYPELTKGANKFGEAWNKTLQTPQQKLHNLEQGAQALAVTAGNVLMPYVNKGLGGLDTGLQWLQSHALASKGLALGGGALVAGGLAKGLFSGVESSLSGFGKIGKALHIPGMDKLASLGSSGAALDGAAGSLKGAAASLEGAAASLKEGGLAGGAAGAAGKGAAAGEAAAAAEGAAAAEASRASRIKGAAVLGAGGALAALTIVDPILRSMRSGPGGKNWFENPFGMAGPHDKGSAGNWLTSFAPYERLFHTGSAPAPAPAVPAGMTPAYAARFGGGTVAPAPAPRVTVTAPAAAGTPMLGFGGHQFTIKPKIQPPDTGAISGALARLGNAVHLKPLKMPAPDMSAMDAAKGKAQSAANAITQSMQSALHKVVKASPPDISAYRSAVGPARADGAAISSGLAGGILAGEGAVVAAARQVAAAASAAMAGALQVHSPSKVTEKHGKDFDKGFVVGLQGGQSAVDAAAAAVGKSAAKAADIASIDATTKKLLGQVPKGDTALTAMLKADNKALDNMARTRAKLEQEISDSEQVAKSMVSGASIMNSLNAVNPAGAEPISSYAVVQGQQYQAASMKQFAQSLMKLQKMGLNATALSQIAQAGPDQGLGIAQGIASGGPQAVKQLNQLQKQIQASAAQVGNVAGPAMYQAGKDVAAGLAAGLKSELGSLDKAMEHLAKSMVASVSKHVKDAKKAAHKAGASVGSGAASGASSAVGGDGSSYAGAAASLSHAGAALTGAAAALTAAATALRHDAGGPLGSHIKHPVAAGGGTGRIAPGTPVYGGGHYGTPVHLPGGGGGQHIHYHVVQNVQGNVHAMTDLASALADHFVQRSTNNWRSGLVAPGRTV